VFVVGRDVADAGMQPQAVIFRAHTVQLGHERARAGSIRSGRPVPARPKRFCPSPSMDRRPSARRDARRVDWETRLALQPLAHAPASGPVALSGAVLP
jgi:hypothetical protein